MTAKGHFVHYLGVLGVRIAGCPPGSTGPIQSESGAGANPLFCRAWISVKCSRAICAASAPCQGLVAGSAVARGRHGPDLYQLARARNVQCEHRNGRKTCRCAGHRTGRIAAACVEAEPKQIRKRRSRVTMTIELCALATVLQAATCCDAKLTDEAVSLKRLLCIMAEGHLVFISPAYWGCAE